MSNDWTHVCYVLKCTKTGFKDWKGRWWCQKHYELFTQIEGNHKITEFIKTGRKPNLTREEFREKTS